MKEDVIKARYDTFTKLWMHHNDSQLRWPSATLGAAIAVIAFVVPSHVSKLLDVSLWGQNSELAVSAGLPLSLAAIGIITMLYTMRRGRKIMLRVEQEIDEIEQQWGVPEGQRFSKVNHAPGFSGPRLIRFFLAYCLAVPMLVVGLALIFGQAQSFVLTLLVGGLWLWFEEENQIRTYTRQTLAVYRHWRTGRKTPKP